MHLYYDYYNLLTHTHIYIYIYISHFDSIFKGLWWSSLL